jgi:hypothetical protein
MGRPASPPLIDGLIVEITAGTDLFVGKFRVLGQHQCQTGAADVGLWRGVTGHYASRFLQMLGRESRLVMRLRKGHVDLPCVSLC